jgi:hypothetical protein
MNNRMKTTHLPNRSVNRYPFQTKLAAGLDLMGRIRKTSWVIILMFVVFLVGCSTIATPDLEDPTIQPTLETGVRETQKPTEAGSSPTPQENPEEGAITEPAAETPAYDPALEPLVVMAVQDLSERLGIDVDQIKVTSAEMVVWPDASLGCPQPDMVYKQVPEDGTLIFLEAAGKVYEYHGGGWTDPFLCEQVIKTKPTTPKIDLNETAPPPGGSIDQ